VDVIVYRGGGEPYRAAISRFGNPEAKQGRHLRATRSNRSMRHEHGPGVIPIAASLAALLGRWRRDIEMARHVSNCESWPV